MIYLGATTQRMAEGAGLEPGPLVQAGRLVGDVLGRRADDPVLLPDLGQHLVAVHGRRRWCCCWSTTSAGPDRASRARGSWAQEAELTELEREFEHAAEELGARQPRRRPAPGPRRRIDRGSAGIGRAGPCPVIDDGEPRGSGMSEHQAPQAPPPRAELAGDGPRRPDRHPDRRPDRHAGPAHGQARPGPGLPRGRHRPRRPLLHVPPGHGHGDEHARGLRPHELGDRLRRLDGPPGLGHPARPALAGEDGPRPQRHDRRGDARGDPGLAAHHPEAPGGARGGARLRHQGRLGVRVLPPARHVRPGQRQGRRRCPSGSATTTRTTTCSRRPRASRSTACCATR